MKKLSPALLVSALLASGSLGIAFGQLTGGGLRLAPDYDTFMPPPAGVAYIDPVFGSKIARVSNAVGRADAASGGNLTWIANEYSTVNAFNLDNSKFLLIHESYFALYDGAGTYLRDLPLEINASSEPRWSRKNNFTIFYHSANHLKTYNLTTGLIKILRTFSEYASISGRGEMDISYDGDHFVFCGDRRFIFVYEISTNKKSNVFDTAGRGFDGIQITPKNNVTVTWLQSGTARRTGIELFDTNMKFLGQVAHAGGHMDVTMDAGREVLVWTNSNDPKPIPNCNNGIVKIRLPDGLQTCLTQLDWSLAVHISAPDGNGSVYVDTEAPVNPQPGTGGWFAYTNEILQVKLNGSGVVRWAHHRSRPLNSYNWQPEVTVSRDGSRLLYASNFNLQAIDGYPREYSDAYLIRLTPAASGTSATAAPSDTISEENEP